MRYSLRSLFVNLIIIFLVALLPLQVCSLLINRWCYANTREDLINAAQADIVYLNEEIETTVSLIRSQFVSILNNTTIKNLTAFDNTLSSSERYMLVLDIENLLYFLRNSNPYLSDIKLHYLTLNKVVTSDHKYYSIPESDVASLTNSIALRNSDLFVKDGAMCIGLPSSIQPFSSTKKVYFYIESELNIRQLSSLLSSKASTKDCLTYIVNSEENFILGSSNDGQINDTILSLLSDNSVGSSSISNVTIDAEQYLMVQCPLGSTLFRIVQIIPYKTYFRTPEQLRHFIFIFCIVSVFIILVYCALMYKQVRKPVRDIKTALSKTCNGDFSTMLNENYLSEFNDIAHHYNHMNARLESLISENYEMTIQSQQAELKQLHAQINPHFLYNSFYLLSHSIQRANIKQAEQLSTYLGDYFKYITDQSSDLRPLKDEYEHALAYISIQLMRFDGTMQARIEPLPECIESVFVPRLLLQPVLENSIEHGISTSQDIAIVAMDFYINGDYLMINVHDNGDTLSDNDIELLADSISRATAAQRQHALYNINRRLQLQYGSQCGISLSRSKLGGLCVTETLKTRK